MAHRSTIVSLGALIAAAFDRAAERLPADPRSTAALAARSVTGTLIRSGRPDLVAALLGTEALLEASPGGARARGRRPRHHARRRQRGARPRSLPAAA